MMLVIHLSIFSVHISGFLDKAETVVHADIQFQTVEECLSVNFMNFVSLNLNMLYPLDISMICICFRV